MKFVKRILMVLGGLFLFPAILVGALTLYWDFRAPPAFEYDPVLKLKHWTTMPAGDDPHKQHKSNTDMIHYKGSFLLIHAETLWHLEDKNGALVVQQSADAKNWKEIARITVPDTDVRDPKFAIIHGRLFLYFLPNKNFDPWPKTTFWSVSDDGVNWKRPEELVTVTAVQRVNGKDERVTSGGWNLWRPKTRDGQTWYVIASGFMEEGRKYATILIKTTDGINWEEVSKVYTQNHNGEPAMEFLPDGSIIATLRCHSLGTKGYAFGNPTSNTTIATASPPYKEWRHAHSMITRLDGATLFPLEGRVFAVGRNHLGPRFDLGNHLGTKRTTFYEVKSNELVHLFDLPSSGDTAYTGVVLQGDDVYACYYTPPIDKDYGWVYAICFKPKTDIRMAKVSASGLLQYADKVAAREQGE